MKLVLELSFVKATDVPTTMVRYRIEIKDATLWQAIENVVASLEGGKLPWVGGHRVTRGLKKEEEKIPWGHYHGLQGDGNEEKA